MALTLQFSLEDFKAAVLEFCKAAPSCNRASLENGLKGVNLMYLGMKTENASDVPIAVSFLDYAHKQYLLRDYELCSEEGAVAFPVY